MIAIRTAQKRTLRRLGVVSLSASLLVLIAVSAAIADQPTKSASPPAGNSLAGRAVTQTSSPFDNYAAWSTGPAVASPTPAREVTPARKRPARPAPSDTAPFVSPTQYPAAFPENAAIPAKPSVLTRKPGNRIPRLVPVPDDNVPSRVQNAHGEFEELPAPQELHNVTRRRSPSIEKSKPRRELKLAIDDIEEHRDEFRKPASRLPKPRYRLANNAESRVDTSVKPLDQIAATIVPPSGKLPPNAAAKNRKLEPEVWQDDSRRFPDQTIFWEATHYEHQPLYFEEINLERYGYDRGCMQPVFSAGNFYGSVALWPYKLVCYPWYECRSTLGQYRPGSCAPYRCNNLPWRLDAALVEVGAWTGLAFLLP